jgi:hypothetical protein
MPLVLIVGFKQKNAPTTAKVIKVVDRVASGPWNTARARLRNSNRRFAMLLENRSLTFARRLGSWSSPVVKRVGGAFERLLKL